MAGPTLSQESRGVMYVAVGERFVTEAMVSARSVRRHMPDLPIHLFTDCEVEHPELFDQRIRIDQSGPKPHRDKLVCMRQMPFDQTLFLDTDTYLGESILDVFDLLDQFDIAATHDRGYVDRFPPGLGIPDAYRELNLGVVLFRKSGALLQLIEKAMLRYDQLGEHGRWYDQTAFRVALYESSLRVCTLTGEYNCRFANFGQLSGRVRVLHGRIPMGEHTEAALQRVLSRLNQTTIPRVFVAGQLYGLAHNPRPFGRPYIAQRFQTLFQSGILWRVRRLMARLVGRHL